MDLSEVFRRWILWKQPKTVNKITKSWDKNTFKGLEQVCPKQAQDFLPWLFLSKTVLRRLVLFSQSFIWLVHSISQWRVAKKIESFWKFYVDGDNNFHFTNFTTLNAALSSYQTFLPCAMHSEMWSCVCMGNSSESKFFQQRDFELWDSYDPPKCPTLWQIKCQESCIVLFLLQGIQPLVFSLSCSIACCLNTSKWRNENLQYESP